MDALGDVWGSRYSGYPLTQAYDHESKSVQPGGSFALDHVDSPDPTPVEMIGYGKYKIKISGDIIYVDFRDCQYSSEFYNPYDLYIHYNASNGKYYKDNQLTDEITANSTYHVWDDGRRSGEPEETCWGPPAVPQNFHVEWVTISGGWNPKLVWNSNTEIDLEGYKLMRNWETGPYSILADLSPSATYYVDGEVFKSAQGGNYYYAHYKLLAYDAATESDSAGPLVVRHTGLLWKQLPELLSLEALPKSFDLSDAYPNPFNPSTTIRYRLPDDSRVQLTIYDIMGREAFTHAAVEEAGYRQLQWQGLDNSGKAVPSGVYLYRLVAGPLNGGEIFVASRKMVLLK